MSINIETTTIHLFIYFQIIMTYSNTPAINYLIQESNIVPDNVIKNRVKKKPTTEGDC